ncbi:hypothetical protein [Pseudonocardia sp. NPDC049154]|uniref:TetR/AcrR family transcriptional regulator n=1 Tax=Pseudonocardia sp. NPDC049154 TaxID=3155501 RepID=UPI0034080180
MGERSPSSTHGVVNEIEYLKIQIAAQRAGLVPVPLNTRLAVPEVRRIALGGGCSTRAGRPSPGTASGTAIQTVLDEAGVKPAALYHHSASKSGLFLAVAEEVYAEFITALSEATAPRRLVRRRARSHDLRGGSAAHRRPDARSHGVDGPA